jgi:hypothetical protein
VSSSNIAQPSLPELVKDRLENAADLYMKRLPQHPVSKEMHTNGLPLQAAAYNPDFLAVAAHRGDANKVVGNMGLGGNIRRQKAPLENFEVGVSEFRSQDHGMLSALGVCSKEQRWKVQVNRFLRPIDIKLHVKMHPLHGPEVQVICDGRQLFPEPKASPKMVADFQQAWPIRGKIRGVKEDNLFEMRSVDENGAEVWYPARIEKQRPDGYLEVTGMQPDGYGGQRKMHFVAVDKAHLREVGSAKPLTIPEEHLTFTVPKREPLQARLTIGDEDITQSLIRFSPVPSKRRHTSKVELRLNKDRTRVTSTVSHAMLLHFITGEVRAVSHFLAKQKLAWTIQLGPFAEHTIEIMKKQSLGSPVSGCIHVDGAVLVEASAEDIGCAGDQWQCRFRFVGQRCLDFEVLTASPAAVPLVTTECVEQEFHYSHDCIIKVKDFNDLSTAVLTVDGKDYKTLAEVMPCTSNALGLSMPVDTLTLTYGIMPPCRVDPAALSDRPNKALEQGSPAATPSVAATASDAGAWCGGAFDCCSGAGSESKDVVHAQARFTCGQMFTNPFASCSGTAQHGISDNRGQRQSRRGATQRVAKSNSNSTIGGTTMTTMTSGVGRSISCCTSKVGFGSPEVIEFID